ncbi:type IV toxin-antitoxin system AbiEi family antitoxin domain-containing protein [Ornithinimicrobium sediminis]|uniref:type IV toxin-antitoxin system AbiEi family antitoxin domain-containing protein n=1 Tax=Ornithinimicrobium sediminis TaxID=2904603 RepID=UPI001E4C8F14|nr:type IV toxin-antitoxin system AbiEi family antitoxin domain-containing protein [Ornithinimicrobium sediminis]MCE0486028.1 type IV toxin-antitoxin system AbiEi family antitoxin domain-containing protein [Ornithinimicrobium sediminis]
MHWKALARRQHGVISRAQALECGLTDSAILHRVTTGRWQRLHRGVYLTHSGDISWHARACAAVLRSGRDAVLALGAAAYLWGLQERPPSVIPVAVPVDRAVVRAVGTRVRRRRHLDTATLRGLPVTSAAQTVVDLAGEPGCRADHAVALVARVVQLRRCTADDLMHELEGRRAHRHRVVLRAALGDVASGVESVAEHRYARDVERAHGLPTFVRQSRVCPGEGLDRRDFECLEFGVVVEVDGGRWHTGTVIQADRRRDRGTAADGKVTLRAGWDDVTQRPCEVAVDVALTLRQRGWLDRPKPCSARCAIRRLGAA